MRARRIAANTVIYVILCIMSITWLLPILWLLLQSFSSEIGTASMTKFVPNGFTFDNYINLFTNQVVKQGTLQASAYDYPKMFLNTLLIAVVVCLISTILVLATSYAFSRLRFKSRKMFMKVILVLGMFPGFLGLIILYNFFKLIGLQGSVLSLIIIYSGGAGMGYYISKGFFDTISKSIDEAAMIDGANRFQIFYKITLPLSKPIVVYTILTSFMGPWAEYITASYMIGTSGHESWTVAVGLKDMLKVTDGTLGIYWRTFCCGSVIIAIPIALLFIFLQKFYVSGVTGGAVKG